MAVACGAWVGAGEAGAVDAAGVALGEGCAGAVQPPSRDMQARAQAQVVKRVMVLCIFIRNIRLP